MKLTINGNNGEYFEVSNDGKNYGFTLTHFKPTKSEDAKKSHNRSDTFHPTLDEVAKKLVYLQLSGNDVETVLKSINSAVICVANTLKTIKGG